MPKVSVIIPVYGVEQYIERCARSLFEQTLDDMEFIFVDDCSPDRSIEILEKILEEYPQRQSQTKIIRKSKNGGLPSARKTGLQIATGEYIIHCDSDDWVDVTMYEKMYNKAIEEDADIVICQYVRTDGIKTFLDMVYFNRESHISDMLLEKTNWSLCNRLCRRSLYENISYPVQNMGEDCRLVMQLSLKAQNIIFIPKAFYYYYNNPLSICNVPSESASISRYNQVIENVGYVIKLLVGKNLYGEYSAEIMNMKNHCRLNLLPYIDKWKFYRLWLTTYPEINLRFAFVRGLSLRQKLRFYSRMFGIYPLITKIMHG